MKILFVIKMNIICDKNEFFLMIKYAYQIYMFLI